MVNDELERLVALAKEVESEDPIDWGMLSIDEDQAYRMLGSTVIEMTRNDDLEVIRATILKLVVENFVLNLRLKNATSSIPM